MSDRILGAICVLIAAFLIWQATKIETSFIVDPLGPKAFPMIIGAALGLSGIYPLLRPDDEPLWPRAGRLFEIVFAVLVLVGFTAALPEIGFVAATTVAAGLLSWRLGSGPLGALAAGVGIAISVYVVFHLAFGINLARGPWGF